jgi:chlorite dismutase
MQYYCQADGKIMAWRILIFTGMESTVNNGIIVFSGGSIGSWQISSMFTITGEPLPIANKLNVLKNPLQTDVPEKNRWMLKAFISNLRYTQKEEKKILDQQSRALAQPEYNHAALIPIKKSPEWWALAQDERRKIFEDDSRHIVTGMKYLSVISRQLYHCKDLGEPFDFLTWFEFSSEHDHLFDELCYILRQTEEWKYVVREVDIRLTK